MSINRPPVLEVLLTTPEGVEFRAAISLDPTMLRDAMRPIDVATNPFSAMFTTDTVEIVKIRAARDFASDCISSKLADFIVTNFFERNDLVDGERIGRDRDA